MQLILTDVDGVLLNWVDAFHDWMRQFSFDSQVSQDYKLVDSYPNTDPAVITDKIITFNSSARMGFLNPYRDAVEYIGKLHKQGYHFHCISSMGGCEYAAVLRRQNLISLFGSAIQDITILGCGANKYEALSKYRGSGLIWIEDHIGNANMGVDLGLQTFLFNHNYNEVNPTSRPEGFTRINYWKELYEHINS
jgi:hypothetical protein